MSKTISTAKLTNVRAGMEDTDLGGLSDWSEISSPKKRSDDFAKPMSGPYSEDYENGDPRVKEERGIVYSLIRSPRQSAQEAAKRLKRNFAASSGEEDDE